MTIATERTKSLPEDFHSIRLWLNPELLFGDELVERMRRKLSDGKLVVVKDAFKADFAEQLYRCLDSEEGWKPNEAHQSGFHYHHHNLYDRSSYPPILQFCYLMFASRPTKQFAGELTGRDCSGETAFGASWYMPGDYSTPHSDCSSGRTTAFIWHLTKEWNLDWGGDFFWCPSSKLVRPSFNTLFLFNVSRETIHFVLPVSPIAQSKRLAVNGWWIGESDGDSKARNVSKVLSDTDGRITYL